MLSVVEAHYGEDPQVLFGLVEPDGRVSLDLDSGWILDDFQRLRKDFPRIRLYFHRGAKVSFHMGFIRVS